MNLVENPSVRIILKTLRLRKVVSILLRSWFMFALKTVINIFIRLGKSNDHLRVDSKIAGLADCG